MRKGLVVTLGVVALVCMVSPGFALAPIISCVPDIIISDVEDNTQTNDLNFFIFSDALNLDDMVQDADDPSSTIRWSFLETSPGNSIRINQIVSDPLVNFLEPGTSDLRLAGPMATFENILWSGTATTETTMDSMITLVASDGTGTDSVDIIVTTVNDSTADYTDGQPDGVSIPNAHQFLFDSLDNWEWYTYGSLTEPTRHGVVGGSMEIEEGAGQAATVYGTFESSKDPQFALPLQARTGCVMRARYQLRSSVAGEVCPGFRMRANWMKVEYNSTVNLWILRFSDQDFNAEQQLVYATFRGNHVDGREPGQAGQTYTLLYMPEQTDTLETTGGIYLAFDMLDNDTFPGADDAGILSVDQIDVDWFDNPNPGAAGARAEPTLSYTDFSTWVPGVTKIADGWNTMGLSVVPSASGIAITVAPSNLLFEAIGRSTGVTLDPGRYYRVTFMVTSTQTPGGPFGPTVRGAINSLQFVFGCNKDLKGGGLLSAFDATPRAYEVWIQAPVAAAGTSPPATEDMSLIFESYLTENPSVFFPTKPIQGTVTCTEIITESWAPFP